MSLQSMTGFAADAGRLEIGSHAVRWNWELRSVNSKGLDIRLRLPPGYDRLELPIRKLVQDRLARGSVTATLALEDRDDAAVPTLNLAALEAVVGAAGQIRARLGGEAASIDAILSAKGVLEIASAEFGDDEKTRLDNAILASLGKAIDALVAARRQEGAATRDVLAGKIRTIESLANAIAADPSRGPEAIRENLRIAVGRILDGVATIDPTRLAQEVALLAVKADISEELDRLAAHVAAARKLLAQRGPVGRQLDFLAQEFNRECNTICSKSTATAVTQFGLEMKIAIDQLREQIQNVE
jgi:uncharacterized protein (TIGR00255 family)